MSNSFYSPDELKKLGFNSVGANVMISRKCSIYGAENMSIGNNVRIDDFCILSGKINIGNYVHISAYVALYGRGGINIGNFCGISPRSILFSASDDFSGESMVSPMVPDYLTNVNVAPIILNDYVQIGAGTIVLPGVTFGCGSVTGAMSLVLADTKDWTVNIGIPTKYYKDRKKNIIKLSQDLQY